MTDTPLISREPTPEFAAEFNETCERLFACLDDPGLREIATLKMEGFTDSEIAETLSVSRRTVQRRMTMIRILDIELRLITPTDTVEPHGERLGVSPPSHPSLTTHHTSINSLTTILSRPSVTG